jgi:hypothetical protein
MKALSALIFLTSLFAAGSCLADTGGVDSGGGKAVVCRDAQKQIVSAELLDLFEGRILRNSQPNLRDVDFRTQIADLDVKIKKLDSFAGGFPGLVPATLKLFEKATLLSKNVRLEPTHDAIEIVVPRGCQLEQAAVFNTRLDRLFLDSEIWETFDQTNKAALLFHEELYDHLRRQYDEKDSFYTRQVVAHLFSTQPFYGVEEGMPADRALCRAQLPDGELNSHKAVFYLFESPDTGELMIQYLFANGLPMFARTIEKFYGDTIFSFRPSLAEILGESEPSVHLHINNAWERAIGHSSPAMMGYSERTYISYDPERRNGVQLKVGYFRTGITEHETQMYPVICFRSDPR